MSEFDSSAMFDLDDSSMNPTKFDDVSIGSSKFEDEYNQSINQSMNQLASPTASPTLSHASFSSESINFDDELDFPFIGQSMKQSMDTSNEQNPFNLPLPHHSFNQSINEPTMMRSILTEPDIYHSHSHSNNQSNSLFDNPTHDFMFDPSINYQPSHHSVEETVNQSGYMSEDSEPGRSLALSDFNQSLVDPSIQPIRQAINGSINPIIQSANQVSSSNQSNIYMPSFKSSNTSSTNKPNQPATTSANQASAAQTPTPAAPQPKRVALAPLPPPESTSSFSFASTLTMPALANLPNTANSPSIKPVISRRDRSSSEDADDNSSVGSHHSAPVQSMNPSVNPSILQTPLSFHPTCPASPSSAPQSYNQSLNRFHQPLRLSQLPPPGKPGRKRKNRAEGDDESITQSPLMLHSPLIKSEMSSPSLRSLAGYNASITLTDLEPLADPVLEAKRLSRLQRNRASAQLSRERKKAYMSELEGQVKEYQSINQSLEQQMNQLIQENKMLKERIQQNAVLSQPIKEDPSLTSSQSTNQSTSQLDVVVASPSTSHIISPSNTEASNAAKRAKLSAAKRIFNQSSNQSITQSMTPRTTLLMFSLILSIAFFCSIVSLDRETINQSMKQSTSQHSRFSPSALAPGPFRSRVLQSVPDQSIKQEKLALDAPPPLEHDDPVRSQSTNPDDSRALVAVKDSCSTQALVLSDSNQQETDQSILYERIERFSFNNQSIDASPKKSVLFCPNPISVRSPKRESVDRSSDSADNQSINQSMNLNDDNQRSAKRLRRTIGLPLPAPSDDSIMLDQPIKTENKQSINQSMDERLLLSTNDLIDLWLPESEFAQQSINQSIDGKNGFVQVTCQISSINRH